MNNILSQLTFGSNFKRQRPIVEKEIEKPKKNNIRIYEDREVAAPINTFDDLGNVTWLEKLKSEFLVPTPVQMQIIPMILAKEQVIACAPTGSGKTLSYIIPICLALKEPKDKGFRALILVPTKELTHQVHRELEFLETGLKSYVLSKANLMAKTFIQHSKFDILIATPLRLAKGIEDELISLANVRYLIIDEADKLLEPEFLDQVDRVLLGCTRKKMYKAIFSATISSSVESMAMSFMDSPVRVTIGSKNTAAQSIEQELVFVGTEQGKLLALRQMIAVGFHPPVLIFVQSIERAADLFKELVFEGVKVDVMHAEKSDSQRIACIDQFRQGNTWVLICTDLMARGIDFKHVQTVINYDFPQSPASYIHRIGRTGRAGRKGTAITFFTREDADYLRSVVNVMRLSGCNVPEWMLTLKNKKMTRVPRRKPISKSRQMRNGSK